MNQETLQEILLQIILVNPISEHPRINKKLSTKKISILSRLNTMIRSYQELEIGIDLIPYQEAVREIQQIGENEFHEFILEINEKVSYLEKHNE